MGKNMGNIEIYKSNDVFTEDEYVKGVKGLIDKTIISDATVIPHTKDELIYRYDKSLICILNNEIIGHLSLYRTQISELLNLNIGEIGSVIVDTDYRGKGLGYEMIDKGLYFMGNNFDGVIAATISKTMVNLLFTLGLNQIKFPKSYYEEGKKYLSGLLEGGEAEFDNLAKCMFIENKKGEKNKVVELLK